MQYYAGLDVSLNHTAICVVDQEGTLITEAMVHTEPKAIIDFLMETDLSFHRIGLETGNLSSWLYEELASVGMPVICIEARHANTMLKAQPVKTDRNDARGLAQIMRTGWFKPVHIKTRHSQKMRVLLNNRRILLEKRKDIDNQIRGTLKPFGLKMGKVTVRNYETHVRELVGDDLELLSYLEPLLKVRSLMIEQLMVLHKTVLKLVKTDAICRRLMTIPGVGVITALSFRATIDQPERFRRSRDVGAHLGLTPRKYASGETDYNGRITKCGDRMMRSHLYEAAQSIMKRVAKSNRLKQWGTAIAKRSSMKNAYVAVARKIAVIMHRIWVDGTVYQDDFTTTKSMATPA